MYTYGADYSKNSVPKLQLDKFNYKHNGLIINSYYNGAEREKHFLLSSWKLKKILSFPLFQIPKTISATVGENSKEFVVKP